jgi:hypothetical protein
MKLRLNLSTTPQENHRPFIAGTVALGTIALIALIVLSHAAYSSWQSNRELRLEIGNWQQQVRIYQQKQQDLDTYFKTPGARQVIDRSTFLNSMIDERSFPWTRIFADLEKTLPPGVRVVSISPRLVNGRAEVVLEVGVISDEAEIHFLEAIEKSRVFSGIQVDQVRPVVSGGGPDKVLLSLTVWYATA